MSIECPSCRAALSDADVDRDRMIARCGACNAVFDASAPRSGPERRRPPVPMPPQITVATAPERERAEAGYREPGHRAGPAVTIVRRWYTHVVWALLLFLVFWNGVLFQFFFGARDAPLLFRLFPLIHLAAGIWVAYWAIALLFNRTTITVTDDAISVRHAPIPWPGNRVVPAAEVTQLFTAEKVSRGRNGETRSYALLAVMRDGERREIVKGLPEPTQALFLEQRIEERLGIVDVEVGGEYQG
jgi:predicted Zn finger-like uncharacterized protein